MKISLFATFLAMTSVLAYFVFTFFFQLFFDGKITKPKFSIFHILWFLGFFAMCMLIMYQIPDPALANRFQHAFGGGFAVMIVIFCSYRASGVNITKFQFFAISILLATACGVANEMAEYIAQYYLYLMFAPDIYDTWLDLYANTFGILLASATLTPFVKQKNLQK